MLSIIEILINSFAQDTLTLDKLVCWFDSLTTADQKQVNNWTSIFLEQSHPNHEIIEVGIEQIPLKKKSIPIAILKSNSLKAALNKIIELPDTELKKAFISLVTLFKVADQERREKWCKEKCEHDWHNLDKLNIELKDEYLERLRGRLTETSEPI